MAENTLSIELELLIEETRKRVRDVNKALGDFEKSAGGAGKRLKELQDQGKKVPKELPDFFKRADDRVKKFNQTVKEGKTPLANFIRENRTMGDVARNAAGFVAGLNPVVAVLGTTALLAARAIGQMVDQQTRLGEETQVLSERLGISAEGISRLRVAASLSNVDIGALQLAIRTLQRNVGQAAAGSEEMQKKFKALGVEIRDQTTGAIKPAEQLMGEIGDQLSKSGDASIRAAKGASVYGRSVAQAIPFLGLSAREQAALTREADIFGGVISGDFARASDEYRDNLERIRLVNDGLKRQLAEQLLPLFNGFATQSLKLTLALKILGIQIFGVGNGIKGLEEQIRTGGDRTGELTARLERMRAEAAKDEQQLDLLFEGLNNLNQGFGDARKNARAAGESIGDLEEDLDKLAKAVASLADEFEIQFARLAGEPEPVGRALFEAGKRFVELGDKGKLALDALIVRVDQLNNVGEFSGKLDSTVAALDRLRDSLAPLPDSILKQLEEFKPPPIGPLTRGFAPAETFGRAGAVGPPAPVGATPIPISLPPEAQPGPGGEGAPGLAEVPLQVEMTAEEIEGLGATFTTMFDVAGTEAEEFFRQTVDLGQASFQALDSFAGGFADALTSGADLAKIRFGDFFKELLRDILKAIIRALILKAVLGIFGGGVGGIGKFLKGALGGAAGTGGFPQAEEAALAGRAQIARSGAALEPATTAAAGNIQLRPTIVVHEPGPLTKVMFTDRVVIPRLRQRQRQLAEEPF